MAKKKPATKQQESPEKVAPKSVELTDEQKAEIKAKEAKEAKETKDKERRDKAKEIKKKQPVDEFVATKNTIEGALIVSTKQEGGYIHLVSAIGCRYKLTRAEYMAL
jgi:hypothetical protein